MRKFARIFTFISLMTFVSLFYNNCAEHTGLREFESSEFSSEVACVDGAEETLFSASYPPGLKNRCASCHIEGGSGPGNFAENGVERAYSSFQVVGAETINGRAVDGHSSGSGPQNSGAIEEANEIWLAGLQEIQKCSPDGSVPGEGVQDSPDRIRTKSLAIKPEIGESTTLTWKLKDDLVPKEGFDFSNFSDAQISVDVAIMEAGGKLLYVVSRPRISSSNVDVHVKSMLVRLNGEINSDQRAYYFVDNNIRAWNSDNPGFNESDANRKRELQAANNEVAPGTLVIDSEVRQSDLLSLSFETIEVVELPAPDAFPTVQFAVTSMTIVEDNVDGSGKIMVDSQGDLISPSIASVEVTLSNPWPEVTSVDLEFGNNMELRDECCSAGENADRTAIRFENFDRDFELVNSLGARTAAGRVAYASDASDSKLRVTFSANETSKTIYFLIIPDERDEVDERLHLVIGNRSKLQAGSSNQEFTLTVTDNDSPYTGTAWTYSALMSGRGTLSAECVRCHNSVDKRGGYDMTNYWQMRSKDILIPNNPSSNMFARMNPDDPINSDPDILEPLQPMPLTGFLGETSERDKVRNWILQGAGNN